MESQLRLLTVVELPEFLRQAADVWSEEERSAFVDYIAANPTAGVVIEGAGGVRKVRWGREGMGKRGGVRVIYYYHDDEMPLFLVSMFAKSSRADLSPAQKADARQLVRTLKQRRKVRES